MICKFVVLLWANAYCELALTCHINYLNCLRGPKKNNNNKKELRFVRFATFEFRSSDPEIKCPFDPLEYLLGSYSV